MRGQAQKIAAASEMPSNPGGYDGFDRIDYNGLQHCSSRTVRRSALAIRLAGIAAELYVECAALHGAMDRRSSGCAYRQMALRLSGKGRPFALMLGAKIADEA